MGCVTSKTDINDIQYNLFQVWNVDESGRALKPGRMEVTESEIILHQKGKDSIRWPMRCLRRYGFDAEMFSFESGRRCPTGAGIYGFKCRRAEALFNLVQEHVQGAGAGSISSGGEDRETIREPREQLRLSNLSQSNGNLSTGGVVNVIPRSASVSESHYIEPICRIRLNNVNLHRSESGNRGLVRNGSQVTSEFVNNSNNNNNNNNNSAPLTITIANNICTNAPLVVSPPPISGSPHYCNDEIWERSGSVSRGSVLSPVSPPPLPTVHEYVNSNTVVENVASSNTSRTTSLNSPDLPSEQSGTPTDKSTKFVYSVLDGNGVNLVTINGCRKLLSTHHREHSLEENLPKLLKQDLSSKSHLYMNVTPDDSKHSERSSSNINKLTILPFRERCYANVGPSSERCSSSSSNYGHRRIHHVRSMSDSPPTAHRKMNYAVLDLEPNNSETTNPSCTSPVSVVSMMSIPDPHPAVAQGYATIDFDRTQALSNSVGPCLENDDSVRKTRHNSMIKEVRLARHGSAVSDM